MWHWHISAQESGRLCLPGQCNALGPADAGRYLGCRRMGDCLFTSDTDSNWCRRRRRQRCCEDTGAFPNARLALRWCSPMHDGTLAMSAEAPNHDAIHAQKISTRTIENYDRIAVAFCNGTADHDVSQNITALLEAIKGDGPHVILDLGCGPGRDLCQFTALGHEAVGLDGSIEFVRMARSKTDCEVLHQDFLNLELPLAHFDGDFRQRFAVSRPGRPAQPGPRQSCCDPQNRRCSAVLKSAGQQRARLGRWTIWLFPQPGNMAHATLLQRDSGSSTTTTVPQGGRERSSHGSSRSGARVRISAQVAIRLADPCRNH